MLDKIGQKTQKTKNKMTVYYNTPGLLEFKIKHSDEKKLPEPGLYRVDLSIEYLNDKWGLFNVNGEPNADISVEFNLLKTTPYSIFYYLPFDGRIGESNLGYERKGYGAGYTNLGQEEIKINSEITLGPMLEGSNTIKEIEIEEINSLTKMNSNPDTRGSILKIDYADKSLNTMEMKFYPTKATPVVLNMNHEEDPNAEPFNYYYGMIEQEAPVLAGIDQLAYWKGAGACIDFEGEAVQEYRRWDSKVTEEPELINNYKVEWDNAVKGGNTYLKTIIYTPTERNIQLKTYGQETSSLTTPDIINSTAPIRLNGIFLSVGVYIIVFR